MTVTVSQALLEDACERAGLASARLELEYSGRGMYGRTCPGLVHDTEGELLLFVAALATINSEPIDWVSDVRQDDFGRSIISYWPKVSVDPTGSYAHEA